MKYQGVWIVAAILLAAASATYAAPVVTDARLSGPDLIWCPPDGNCATYVIWMTGTGAAYGDSIIWAVYQDEIVDDELVAETTEFIGGTGPTGEWSLTTRFQLCCKYGCEVTGPAGSCWDGSAQVYALIEDWLGNDLFETARIPVTCGTPEPATGALLLGALGLLGLLSRRRRI